jgi:hypothetical protein
MINTLAIFAAGAAEEWGSRVMLPAPPHSPRAVRGLGVAFVNGAPARRFPVTAPFPAALRPTFSLPAPAFYSP